MNQIPPTVVGASAGMPLQSAPHVRAGLLAVLMRYVDGDLATSCQEQATMTAARSSATSCGAFEARRLRRSSVWWRAATLIIEAWTIITLRHASRPGHFRPSTGRAFAYHRTLSAPAAAHRPDNVAATLRGRASLAVRRTSRCRGEAFSESVRAKALGADVLESLKPGQAFLGILHTELVQLMSARLALEAARTTRRSCSAAGLQAPARPLPRDWRAWLIERVASACCSRQPRLRP